MQKVRRAACFASVTYVQIASISLLLVFLATAVRAQNTTDGSTPLGLARGAPAGSYGLSGFDHINPFNGNLNFALPLGGAQGRGGAHYTMMLPIEQKWTVHKYVDEYSVPPSGYSPLSNWWNGVNPDMGPACFRGAKRVHNPGPAPTS